MIAQKNYMFKSLAIWLIHLEYRTGTHTSGVQQIFWAVIFLSSIISIRSAVLQSSYEVKQIMYCYIMHLSYSIFL